jgi:hypothetical protein
MHGAGVDLGSASFTRRLERDLLPVRRPDRSRVVLGPRGEAGLRAAGGVEQPDVAAVRLVADVRGGARAVRGEPGHVIAREPRQDSELASLTIEPDQLIPCLAGLLLERQDAAAGEGERRVAAARIEARARREDERFPL